MRYWKYFIPDFFHQVRYKSDCEKFSGRILDNNNVVSSIQGISARETEEIWNKLYPAEPYEFDSTSAFSHKLSNDEVIAAENCTDYDLVKAIERQSPFFYQVIETPTENYSMEFMFLTHIYFQFCTSVLEFRVEIILDASSFRK